MISLLEGLGADDICDAEGGGDDGAAGDFARVAAVVGACCGEDDCVGCYGLYNVKEVARERLRETSYKVDEVDSG